MTTINDVELSPGEYVEVYTATGITAGTQLVIQSKSRGWVNVQNRSTQPAADDHNGFIIPPMGIWRVPTGTLKAWFKGQGSLAVETL